MTAPSTNLGYRPPRTFTVEHRSLARPDGPRLKPKPDAAVQLREVADTMRNLPRECLRDPAELFILMRRLAGRVKAVADSGLEVAPAAVAPRRAFLAPGAGQDAVDAVFGSRARRSGQVGVVTNRKGRSVPVEIRRARAAGQFELAV